MLVDFVSVIELGQHLVAVAQQNYTGSFVNGGSFNYTSIISSDNNTDPRVIQLNLYGQNAEGQAIVNILAVSYTNNCSAYPVFNGTFPIGWIDMVSGDAGVFGGQLP